MMNNEKLMKTSPLTQAKHKSSWLADQETTVSFSENFAAQKLAQTAKKDHLRIGGTWPWPN